MKKVISIIKIVLFLGSLLYITGSFIKGEDQKRMLYQLLKSVRSADTPEVALKRLNKTINYIEENNLTCNCFTLKCEISPETAKWFENIQSCRDELQKSLGGSESEKENTFDKISIELFLNGIHPTISAPHSVSSVIFLYLSIITALSTLKLIIKN